ncbi:hypothetical protein GZL_09291 [Streptomyces sp. 769]|nr:hypothetical protein GZL_09291 [Streptomyces sp. 769]
MAIEPTPELSRPGGADRASQGVRWLDDALPGLAALLGLTALTELGDRDRCFAPGFDLVLLTAVWACR